MGDVPTTIPQSALLTSAIITWRPWLVMMAEGDRIGARRSELFVFFPKGNIPKCNFSYDVIQSLKINVLNFLKMKTHILQIFFIRLFE
jgi:hypothetical protein